MPPMAAPTKSRSRHADAAAEHRSSEHWEAEFEEDGDLIDPSGHSAPLTGEMWNVNIQCKGQKDRIVQAILDKGNLTFFNLMSFKEQLGYGVRDYFYYKKRCGRDLATLETIDYSRDAENMLQELASEKKVRLILTKEQEKERHVIITPLKRPRENDSEDEDDDDDDDTSGLGESVDEYKNWLKLQYNEDHETDLHDDYREETIRTYTDWLRVQGLLKRIMAYKAYNSNNQQLPIHDESNGGNETPATQWPSHARKLKKQTKDGKQVGRGTLKGLAAMSKRMKERSQKLKIEFSANLGGPCGENRRTFVDEVVMYTRLNTPLGVRHWKDTNENVKNTIAESVLNVWDMEDSYELREKIWKIAKERYKGWRSTFSATYRAFDSYDARMKNKPQDLDITEWHYLITYFGSRKFKKLSNQNSSNRQQMKTTHLMGSKPFSQCSWEKRDPITKAEPGPLELWKTTHTKGGKWSNKMSESIYTNAARKLSLTETNELGEEESRSTITSTQEDLVFQATYKETTGTKSNKLRGHSYLTNANKTQLLHQRIEEQGLEVQKLKEQLAEQPANKEAEKEQLKASIRAELMQEFQAMMAQNSKQASIEDVIRITTPQTNNTVEDEARSTQDNNGVTPVQGQETLNQGTYLITPNQIEQRIMMTTEKENVEPTCNQKNKIITKNLFGEDRGNGAATKYISSQQLLSGVKTRGSKKKQ
ncbi:hypothetical protein ACP4OV_000838 [Aristida adscensionis]